MRPGYDRKVPQMRAEITGRRLFVRLISAAVLDQYMRFGGETNRSLAAKVGRSAACIAHLPSRCSVVLQSKGWGRRSRESPEPPSGPFFSRSACRIGN